MKTILSKLPADTTSRILNMLALGCSLSGLFAHILIVGWFLDIPFNYVYSPENYSRCMRFLSILLLFWFTNEFNLAWLIRSEEALGKDETLRTKNRTKWILLLFNPITAPITITIGSLRGCWVITSGIVKAFRKSKELKPKGAGSSSAWERSHFR